MTNLRPVWILLDSRHPGGIESHVLQLASGLKTQQVTVTVLFFNDYGPHPLQRALHRRGIAWRRLDGKILTLWQQLRMARPALLHTHGYKAGILGRIAAKLNHIPVVSTYHAGETATGKLGFYQWLDRHSARLADVILAVSPQIASSLPATAQLTDNFIDTSQLSISRGHQLAFVGRASREKGPDHFVQLARHFPHHVFHFYGDGPLAEKLQASAPANLTFHGQQSDMTGIWPQIGLLIMPSRQEGLPMAALEAMGRGIPVLAYRVGALDQLLDSGNNGWLIEPGDHRRLSGQLAQWLSMTAKQQQPLKLAARQTILARFSSASAILKLLKHYRQIAN